MLLGTTTGVYVLDIVDHFINRFGILLVAVASMLVLSWVFKKTGLLRDHLNRRRLGVTSAAGGWR